MEIFHNIKPIKNSIIALGFFDGIHIAHKTIINTLVKEATQKKVSSVIVSFEENPSNYFREEKIPALQSSREKEDILENCNVDYFFELDFEQYKEMSALEYLRDVLCANFSPSIIIVGYNHTFGKDKEGNASFLREYADKFGYKCITIPEVTIEDLSVSSSAIREYISQGKLDQAKLLLGRRFSLRNSVIKGNKIARNFKCPTANLIWPDTIVKLPYGVYYGLVKYEKGYYPALISWGKKPTLTKGEEEILEAHIYNFNKEIYGKIISVFFERKIRDEIKFLGMKPLVEQIQEDYKTFEKWAKVIQKILNPNA